VQYEAAYFEGGKQVVIGPFDSAVRAAAAYVAEVEGRLERAEAKEEAARQKLERQEERAREKEEAKRKREERNKEEVLVYDESLVGRRVRCLWEAYGEWFVGTLIEYRPPQRETRSEAEQGRYLVRYDDQTEEEVGLPDNTVKVLPKDVDAEKLPELTLEEERIAWLALAKTEEEEAKAEIKASGFTLHTSERTDTGYRCVYAHYLSRLGVVAYEVRAARDGKLEYIGRFKLKLAAAVAFSRFEAGMPSRRGGGHDGGPFGNMVLQVEMPASMEDGVCNTIEKILDFRVVDVDDDDAADGAATADGGKLAMVFHRTKACVAASAAGFQLSLL
jgi:hypothetical protein